MVMCALQVNFPRSPRIRKRWLLRRVVELAAFTGLLLFIANQYLEPAVSNAMKPLSQSDWWRVLERVLKLALPNLYAWLVSTCRRGDGMGQVAVGSMWTGRHAQDLEISGASVSWCSRYQHRLADSASTWQTMLRHSFSGWVEGHGTEQVV
jgi:hypothetical protein